MARRKSLEEEMQPIPIRSYNNAFEMQFFNTSAKSFFIDWISLAIITELIILLLGKVYPFDVLYAWLWQNDWYLVQYVLVPAVIPFCIITLTKRDGVSVWRYVVILIEDLVTSDRFAPYYEPPWYKSFWAKLIGKEE